MNIGRLPGYYYDEQKNKYFKIQADHQLPIGSAYTRGAIKVGERNAKRRRINLQRRKDADEQTVKKHQLLTTPVLGSTGIIREHGTSSASSILAAQEVALISHFQPSRTQVSNAPLEQAADGQIDGHSDVEVVDVDVVQGNTHAFVTSRCVHDRPSYFLQYLSWQRAQQAVDGVLHLPRPKYDLAAFTSPITAVDTAFDVDQILVAASCEEGSNFGNIYIGTFSAHSGDDTNDFTGLSRAYITSVTNASRSIWRIAINPVSNWIAMTGTNCVWFKRPDLSGEFGITTNVDPGEGEIHEIRSMDWLSYTVLAYADNDNVRLIDVRSRDDTTRFKLRSVTGITIPGSSGCQLLASTNRAIRLFDLRNVKHDRPLLSFSHVHQGPRLEFTTNQSRVLYAGKPGLAPQGQDEGCLIAAVDRDNGVQIYSIRTGKHVQSLFTPQAYKPLSKLRWREDEHGRPAIRAMQGSAIVEWKWRDEGQ